MAKSTTSRKKSKPRKPSKPSPDFPLFAHNSGRWCKKVNGKFHYFGKWDDPQAAIQRWLREKDHILAGQVPPKDNDSLTVRELSNEFCTHKSHLLKSGDIEERTFADCIKTCETLISSLGSNGANRTVDSLVARDFDSIRATLAKTRGPVTLGDIIGRIRSVFKYGYDAGLIDKPIRYGPGFKKPPRRAIRAARLKKGPRMFEAEAVWAILESADKPMKAMVLLACNCGFGQSDVSGLPQSSVDFEKGWVSHARSKTAIARRCQLWPETIKALKEAIGVRPDPLNPKDEDLCFLTKHGRPWVRCADTEKKRWTDSVGLMFGKLLRELELKRHGLNFYGLRHGFQTVAEESGDFPAVKSLMGHVDESMSGAYRERISDERLKNVTDVVHDWLFSKG